MALIFLQQIHDHLKSLRFQISLLVVVALFAANGAVYIWKYQRLADTNPRLMAEIDRRYDQIETLNDAVSQYLLLLNTRLPSEFMTEGGADWFSDSFYIQAQTGGHVFYGGGPSRFSNRWVRHYEVVDWTLLVRLVITFLCIVLAYDALSREIESGTIRLVLANPIARSQVLLGKFLAHLATVMAIAAVGSLVSLLILSLGNTLYVDWTLARDWALFMVGVAFLAALFLLLAMGVSALAGSSAASLVLLVLTWAVLIVVIPQTSYLIAVQSVDLSPDWRRSMAQYLEEATDGLQREGLVPRARSAAGADGYALEQRYLQRLAEAEAEAERLLKDQYARAVQQYEVARAVNTLSPGLAFQYAVEALLATGLGKYQHFQRQAWAHRAVLRDFIRTRDAADPDSPHLLFLPGFLSDKPVDARQIPRFREEPVSLDQSIRASWVPMLVLVLEVLGAFFFALWAFNRAEIAG